jgi:small subunit ribosomal protein S16
LAAKIRLSRIGTRSKPFYRVIVIDESSARNASPIMVLGHYDPRKEPTVFEVDVEKTQEWLKKGATPTEVVRKYLGKMGVMPPVDFGKRSKKAPKNAETEAAKPA